MRRAPRPLGRYLATAVLTKHRLFVWLDQQVLADHQLIVFARDDDYYFGVLHSRPHELWALAQGTQQEDRPRYTPTTSFQTFPMPHPNEQQRETIAEAAAELNRLREGWLNPDPLTTGPQESRRRTLTNLYNERPAWLETAHRRLDEAVFAAYSWLLDLSDDEVLARLLALNLERAAEEEGASS